MSDPPIDLSIPLPELGELLAKLKKAGELKKSPRLAAIMRAQETKNSRRVKEGILSGMQRVFPEEKTVKKEFDEIFSMGKVPPSANRLFGIGSDYGMMWLAGFREGWQPLEDIMAECHIKTRALAKKYIIPGFYAILGNEEGDIAWNRIYPQVENADEIRLEAWTLGIQLQLDTLHDLKTLKEYAKRYGTTNTRTIRDLFLEVFTELFGEEGGQESYMVLFPHTIDPKIIALLHLEGRQLAELYEEEEEEGILIYPTYTDYMRLYEVYGRDVVSRYILEGMAEKLDKEKLKEARDDIFSQKKHLETEQKDELREVGHELGIRYKKGVRTTSYVLCKLMVKLGIGDIRTAKRHVLLGLKDELGDITGEIALETYFSNVHPNAEAIRQYAVGLVPQLDSNSVKEYLSIDDLGVKFNASAETTSKYLYEGFELAVGRNKAPYYYERAFPHQLQPLLGVYNHPILEEGMAEVATSTFEDPQHAPTIQAEKLEGTVKHDILIENIQEGDWFRKQLERPAPGNKTFLEALKLTAADAAKYKRLSGDLTTRDEPGRAVVKDGKYASEDTLLLMVLTNYNDPDKDVVRAPPDQPNTRIVSAEFFIRFLGGKTPAIELARKVRDLTRQGKVAELRAWKQNVDEGIAPSFLKGQQSLDQWLDANSELGEGEKEEVDPDENEEDEGKEKTAAGGTNNEHTVPEKESAGQNRAAIGEAEREREKPSADREQSGKLEHGQGETGRESEQKANPRRPARPGTRPSVPHGASPRTIHCRQRGGPCPAAGLADRCGL